MPDRKKITLGIYYNWAIYTGSRLSNYPGTIIQGVRAAAREMGCNLLIPCGIRQAAWPETEQTDYVPVGPWNTDGLIVFSPLANASRTAYIRMLHDQGFPIVLIGTDTIPLPTVSVDNVAAIQKALEHLISVHGHKQIAFIAGYEFDRGDSLTRLNTFERIMGEYGLKANPKLIAYGSHSFEGGYLATRQFVQSRERFTALLASNDLSAIGAMTAFQEVGYRIPEDVAVMGFDNIMESLATIPPLSTIQNPIFELGYQALKHILERIEKGDSAKNQAITIQPSLVTRQSCGCLPVSLVSPDADPASGQSMATGSNSPPSPIVEEMVDTLNQANGGVIPTSLTSRLCNNWVNLLIYALNENNILSYRSGLMEIIKEIEQSGYNLNDWQHVVSVIRKNIPSMGEEIPAGRVEDFLHLSREVLSEAIHYQLIRGMIHWNRDIELMGRMNVQFLVAKTEKQVIRSFFTNLSQIGVRNGWIAFYEPQGEDPYANILIWYTEGTEMKSLRISSHQFPPSELLPDQGTFDLTILPLLHEGEQVMGFIALDAPDLHPLAAFTRGVAAALSSARLHEEVINLSLTDSLTSVNNRRYLDIFLEKEVERCVRYNRYLAIILFDIDNLKDYNDTFGHPAGDDVLRMIAEYTRRNVRRGLDVIVRYGGDEFAILLPETDARGALDVAERIRQAVLQGGQFSRSVTISVGIAAAQGPDVDATTLVQSADVALYEAKEKRNTICLFA